MAKETLFSSTALIQVTESAAGTLTFRKLETGISVYDKLGWVISRIEWKPLVSSLAALDADSSSLSAALVLTDTLTALNDTNPAILAKRVWATKLNGTAATSQLLGIPWVDDFSTLPGGGYLTLPNPLYLAVQSAGDSQTATITARIWFQAIPMSDQEYFNLVQSRQLLISS